MPTVRTTIQPGVDIEMSDAEAVALGKQGLLAADPEPDAETVAPTEPAATSDESPQRPARGTARPSSDKPSEG